MLLLELLTVFDPPLSSTECPVLEFADQLWVEGDLLGSDRVQVADTVHVPLCGSHVKRCVVVIVQTPHVGTKGHQKGEAAVVAIGSSQVEWRVAPDVALVWVAARREKQGQEAMLDFNNTCTVSLNPVFCYLQEPFYC